ncbi:MAG: glycosyltransferase family 2 protein [Candidatus Kryptoniota bacterium]
MTRKISVIIIAGNEENNIAECLESVLWADEIIVVDSGSTDRTVEIARTYTTRVFVHQWEGYAAQKSYALSLAGNEWVLSIDADERVSPELKLEIENLDIERADGYKIPRRNYFLGKVIKSCGWYPDYQLRLFKKSRAGVTNRQVHEGFFVNGRIERLKNDIIHYTHMSITGTLRKINEYSSLQAIEKATRKHVHGYHILLHPTWAFFQHFILRKGFKDGTYGLMVSLIHAMTNMQTYMKIWEMQNAGKKR